MEYPQSFVKNCDAALVYVQEHFRTNIWAIREIDMSICAGTETINTINRINELRQQADMNSGSLTINADTCLNVLDNPELLAQVLDNDTQQFFLKSYYDVIVIKAPR